MSVLSASFFIPVLSLLFRRYYGLTRKQAELPPIGCRPLLFCFAFDLILNALLLERCAAGFWHILFLIELTADIDVLIRKIPTELLLLLTCAVLRDRTAAACPWLFLLMAAGSGSLWFVLRKKTGIAVYDIILIILMAMLCADWEELARFHALILIFWGGTGLILQKVFKKSPRTAIPLVPVIAAAWAAARLLSLR